MHKGHFFVSLLAVALAGCASHDYTSECKWAVEAPKSVDKGTELVFKVTAVATVEGEEKPVEGISYHYQIHWQGGTVQPLRHAGLTGAEQKRRAATVPGNATLIVTRENLEGALVKVAEATVEVK